ncbi:hypothetical protein ACTXT7_005510 [Hymenolepis weldensis]
MDLEFEHKDTRKSAFSDFDSTLHYVGRIKHLARLEFSSEKKHIGRSKRHAADHKIHVRKRTLVSGNNFQRSRPLPPVSNSISLNSNGLCSLTYDTVMNTGSINGGENSLTLNTELTAAANPSVPISQVELKLQLLLRLLTKKTLICVILQVVHALQTGASIVSSDCRRIREPGHILS